MREAEFGEELATRIRARVGPGLEVATKHGLLYALAFDDNGRLRLGLNRDREPVRGGGTGFEQGRADLQSVNGWRHEHRSPGRDRVEVRWGDNT